MGEKIGDTFTRIGQLLLDKLCCLLERELLIIQLDDCYIFIVNFYLMESR